MLNCIIANINDAPLIDSIEQKLEKRILSYKSILNDLECFNKKYLIAKIDDEPVGYIGISFLSDHADILALAVAPKFTHKGYAKMLIAEAEKICKTVRIEKVFLEVRASNIPAINLYTTCGFEQISIRKKYYEHSEDANVLCKII